MKSFMKSAVILPILAVGLSAFCGDKSKDDSKPKEGRLNKTMIVVFSTGSNKIVKADTQQTVNAEIGAMVNERDVIKTENGTLDLQTRDGSAIRVREFTTITVTQLIAGNTRLDMKQGGILASVNRQSPGDKFTVATPTAIAGVRGTIFKVDMTDESSPPKVKVLDGKVAMSPRIPAMEKMSEDQIKSSPALQKIAATLQNETVIEEKNEGTLDPKLESKVKEANLVLEKAISEKKDMANSKETAKAAQDLEKQKKTIVLEKSEVTFTEKQESGTLVTVDTKVFDSVISSQDASRNEDVANLKKTHELIRLKNQEKVLKDIERDASQKSLKTEEAIKQQYNKLELLVLKNGEKIRGAVIAQTGNVMVVHTKTGVMRIKKADVDRQEFLFSN